MSAVECCEVAASRRARKFSGVVGPVVRMMTDIAVEETEGVCEMRAALGKVVRFRAAATW